MKIATVAKVKTGFNTYLKECREGPIIVTKNGRPVAALISVSEEEEEEELERLVLAHTPKFNRLLDTASQRIRKTGGIRHEDFWKSFDSSAEK